VYEDDQFIAFLDIHPSAPGHVQVIPKEHYRWVWDVPHLEAYFKVVAAVAKAERTAFNTDWVLSKIVGDEIAHAHVWVFPNNQVEGDPRAFEANAEKLRKALSA
jgi:histidine triad (HIT) family protein